MPAGALLLGRFSDLLIGNWGTLELQADPYGSNFDEGPVSVRTMMDVDFAVRHPEAFSVITPA